MAARFGRCLVFAALIGIAGCGESDVVRVHDETAPAVKPPAPIPPEQQRFRTLAAMVPAELDPNDKQGPAWIFFKTSGPYVTVAKYENDFNAIVDSIHANADEKDPVSFAIPAGWTLEKADKSKSDFSIATLKAPGGELELTITRLGGSVLANVQRWWGQLWGKDKMNEFTVAMLPDYVRERNIHGRLVLTVDMAGPNEPTRGPMMMKGPHGGM